MSNEESETKERLKMGRVDIMSQELRDYMAIGRERRYFGNIFGDDCSLM